MQRNTREKRQVNYKNHPNRIIMESVNSVEINNINYLKKIA